MDRNRNKEPQDLADAIEGLNEPETPEEETEEEKKPKDRPDLVMKAWNENAKKPSEAQIEGWKSRYGDNIFMIALDEAEMYVWRPISRHEYKALIQTATNEQQFMEQVVQKCVLWPSVTPEWLAGGKGGTVPTLHGVIMEGSNFLAPEVAMSLVRKL